MRKISIREEIRHITDRQERINVACDYNNTELYYWWLIEEFNLGQYQLRHVDPPTIN